MNKAQALMASFASETQSILSCARPLCSRCARTIDFCYNEPPSNYVPLTFNGSDIIGFSLLRDIYSRPRYNCACKTHFFFYARRWGSTL